MQMPCRWVPLDDRPPPLGEAGPLRRDAPLVDKTRVTRRLPLLLLCVLALGGSSAQALRMPSAPRCPVFPKSNPWNQRVDRLPVAANSDEIVRSIGAGGSVHADFGSGLWEGAPIGIPITVVGKRQAKKRVSFEYADESDRGPYPIPRNVKIEGGRSSDGRPARAHRRPRLVPSLRALRALSERAAAGEPGRARSGTSARTSSGPRAGPRPTRPACRSSPGSRATTRSSGA